MGAVKALPRRPLTRADLETMPDDGHRYELIDGLLIVSPAPSWLHQRMSGHLYLALALACPPELEVLFAPFDVALADDTVVQPDLLVVRRSDYAPGGLRKAPLLALEVLSPTTRRFDLMLKRSRLEAAGCASYWVVDPEVPSLIAWELRDGVYVEVAKVTGDDVFHATQPFAVDVVPGELVL
ncbi:MAG TPA: Uma2 family endonuclease [Kribbellaceae bacterium]|jgi:Uma2 family endonuclease